MPPMSFKYWCAVSQALISLAQPPGPVVLNVRSSVMLLGTAKSWSRNIIGMENYCQPEHDKGGIIWGMLKALLCSTPMRSAKQLRMVVASISDSHADRTLRGAPHRTAMVHTSGLLIWSKQFMMSMDMADIWAHPS